jgi:hypothetical protein
MRHGQIQRREGEKVDPLYTLNILVLSTAQVLFDPLCDPVEDGEQYTKMVL